MQMHLDTIPLWDSFREGDGCPLCRLTAYLEEQFLDGTLGGAAMEPDIRIMSNEKGYCLRHFKALYDRKQRLPLALITHTHLVTTREKLDPLMEQYLHPPVKKQGLFAKKTAEADPVAEILNILEQQDGSCMICQRVEGHMARYLETCADLYRKDETFARLYREGKGFCLPHFRGLLQAGKGLSGKARESFLTDTLTLEQGLLDTLDTDLKAFTMMFDYRSAGKDFGPARDALPRTIAGLRGNAIPMEGKKST